jgi:hypothetical protein
MSDIDTAATLDDLRRHAAGLGVLGEEFERAAAIAVKETTRTLARLAQSRMARDIGSVSAKGLGRRIVHSPKGASGLVWIGTRPVSASLIKPAVTRKAAPGAFVIPGISSTARWTRATPSTPFAVGGGRFTGKKGGRVDARLRKIFRDVHADAERIAAGLRVMAPALLEKNLTRQIDRALRKRFLVSSE